MIGGLFSKRTGPRLGTESLVVAAAGALGAVCRYLIGGLMQSRVGWEFPPELVVNLAGSFVMGLIVASSSGRGWSVVAVGFLEFTTFSWMVETLRLGLPSPRASSMSLRPWPEGSPPVSPTSSW